MLNLFVVQDRLEAVSSLADACHSELLRLFVQRERNAFETLGREVKVLRAVDVNT